ncbi:MAG: hypothetical protein E6I89_10725 [Chloroflexi bacterium]|nr:MAG: hypothetical protein E6I89_10725 [Chloroflexota bacterium]
MRFTVLNIRTRSPKRSLQEGQAIVLIALLILVLFGMLGLAIDSGRAYVDRRDQQTAVDAAALAAGDWYDNYPDYNDLVNTVIPQSVAVYEANLRIYTGLSTTSHTSTTVGVPPNDNLPQDAWHDTFAGGYILDITATNTQFNGYQFTFLTNHNLPLAFIQIFGGSPAVGISATATSIVGNQRQTPALLTLSPNACATQLQGSGTLTILGDAYTNGTACVDANLHLAGNCYGQAGSNCNAAQYFCYNSSPGFIPYAPGVNGCNGGDTIGNPVVPAPTLPDPGYTATSQTYYGLGGATFNRGGYVEMTPGTYNNWSVNGGTCYFMDGGVYTWNGGYTSHGGMTSNELKPPGEVLWSQPGSTNGPSSSFWGGCDGSFNVSVAAVPAGNGLKHQGAGGNWGIELTSVRYDRFLDNSAGGNVCFASPGCRRESAPSACVQASNLDTNDTGINVNITQNAPGAQYYNVYIDPYGCETYACVQKVAGQSCRDNFSFVGTYLAPGWTDGGGPPAVGVGPYTGTLLLGRAGWNCPVLTVSVCKITANNVSTTFTCDAQSRGTTCRASADEVTPQCFANCPPAATVPQDNHAMGLEWAPYNGGDVANENYCQQTPASGSGDTNAPCATAKITPGAVQFWFPAGNNCLDQNGNGSTHVFSGEQYNWIVIYQQPGSTCSYQKLNGNAFTQYIGTIYSPTASWDILGSDTSPPAGQVIAYAAKVTGSANAGIDFNPNYSPAPPAARLIN